MFRAVAGYIFVCMAIIGLPTIYHYRPPGTWADRLGMIAEGRLGHITEPWFQISMTVVALTGALGLILLFGVRKSSRIADAGTRGAQSEEHSAH
jgi:hypothetical protein